MSELNICPTCGAIQGRKLPMQQFLVTSGLTRPPLAANELSQSIACAWGDETEVKETHGGSFLLAVRPMKAEHDIDATRQLLNEYVERMHPGWKVFHYTKYHTATYQAKE